MSPLKIAIVYFSATGVTHIYANAIKKELEKLGCNVVMLDVTPFDVHTPNFPVQDFDNFIFGFPVYGDFAPSVINDWLATLDGKGKRCAMFFTYGGRTAGYAHFHTKMLLEDAGYQVLFSAEYLGRHSLNHAGWNILPYRPDKKDFSTVRDYAHLALQRFTESTPPVFWIQKPFGYNDAIKAVIKKSNHDIKQWPLPKRFTEVCQMCLECQKQCPTQSFDAKNGLSDPTSCIRCMHCIAICPDGAIQPMENERVTTKEFLDYCHLTEEMLAAKRSKIITDP